MQTNMQPKTAKYTAHQGALIYMLAIVVNMVLQFTLGTVFGETKLPSGEKLFDNLIFKLVAMAVLQLGFFAVVFVCSRQNKISLLKATNVKKVSVKQILISIILVPICLVGFLGLASAFEYFLQLYGYVGQGISMETPIQYIMGVVVICMFAPICEELVFRGVLLQGLRSQLGERATIVLSGLAFTLMHMNPSQTIYQFALGCVLACVVLRTGSIIPAIIMHSVNNLIGILLPLLATSSETSEITMQLIWTMLGVGVVLAIIAYYAIRALVKFMSSPSPQDATAKSAEPLSKEVYKPWATFYFVALFVCVAMWVLTLLVGFGYLV